MSYQNIDAAVSAADLQAVKDAFAAVLNKLPFLVHLTVADRRATAKLGPDSLSFVQNTITAVQVNPKIFPESFDKGSSELERWTSAVQRCGFVPATM